MPHFLGQSRNCRGELWNANSARFYVGRCESCVYSFQPPESRRRKDKMVGLPDMRLCTNHPDCPGELREVMPMETCRNGDKWMAGIGYHGRLLYLGVFEDKIEPAKAHELHGPYAYRNFPEDYPPWKNCQNGE